MIPPWFADVLWRYARVAIVGGPGTGKTTLASYATTHPVIHTDDYMGLAWPDIPRVVMDDLAALGPRWIVEGCQVARCLRKGLHVDVVVVMRVPRRPLTAAQEGLGKGVMTILAEVSRAAPELHFVDPIDYYRQVPTQTNR